MSKAIKKADEKQLDPKTNFYKNQDSVVMDDWR